MILPQPFKCDECPAQKSSESEGGWLIGIEPVTESVEMLPQGSRTITEGVALFPWDDAIARHGKQIRHLCSVSCGTKWMSKRMSVSEAVPPSQR